VLGAAGSALRKSVENRRRYLLQLKGAKLLQIALSVGIEYNPATHSLPSTESESALPVASPPKPAAMAHLLSSLSPSRSVRGPSSVLEVDLRFTEQWRNNGNLFLRARDCDLTELIGGDPDEPIMKTMSAFIHSLSDPSDYGHLSAIIPDDGTGIQFTRPVLSGSLNKASVIDEIYAGMRVPAELKAAHKLAVNRAAKESSRDGSNGGRIPTFTTFYRFPEDFRGSNQFFADSNAAKGELRSIPIHKDINGKFGFRKGKMNVQEEIEVAPIFAVAFLFVEKDFTEMGEEPSTAAPRDLMKDLESKFKSKNKIR
jgi:hypothetical protein